MQFLHRRIKSLVNSACSGFSDNGDEQTLFRILLDLRVLPDPDRNLPLCKQRGYFRLSLIIVCTHHYGILSKNPEAERISYLRPFSWIMTRKRISGLWTKAHLPSAPHRNLSGSVHPQWSVPRCTLSRNNHVKLLHPLSAEYRDENQKQGAENASLISEISCLEVEGEKRKEEKE